MNEFVVSEKRKAIWSIELKIMDEIDRICKKHGIKYFLAGGSMIGAARHNGFIPWDDDIDVGMLRADYERFLQVCKDDLSSQYHLQNNETDKGYYYIHTKIRDSKTTAIRKTDWRSGATFNQGIFVDVVPFDNIPDNPIQRRLHYYALTFVVKILKRHIYFKGIEKPTLKNRIAKMMGNIVFLFTTTEKMSKLNEKLIKYYANKRTRYIGEISTEYKYKRSRRERALYEELIDHPFEDRFFKIPKKYDEILTQAYGDWRTPRPEAPTIHGAVFFDTEHPYTDYLNGKRNVDFDAPL
ncbi:MAG: LicD family protein [Prevotella sp.]|nr:LicD family protein [Prevotella sp.]